MREQVVLDNQRAVNIWIARDGAATGGSRDLMLDSDGDGARDDTAPDTNGDGLPDGDGIVDSCQHQPPANMATAYGFANVRAFIHPATPPPGNVNTLRECAAGGIFSAEATEAGVFIHETGHAGWGMADEYCCDGGYLQPKPNPNIYREPGRVHGRRREPWAVCAGDCAASTRSTPTCSTTCGCPTRRRPT